MITMRKVGFYLTAEPFRPFRINMVNGESFDIRHSDMVLVGRTSMSIQTWLADEYGGDERSVPLAAVSSIEPLVEETAS